MAIFRFKMHIYIAYSNIYKVNMSIRNFRLKNKMTQSELATQLNIKQCSLSLYEKRQRQPDIALIPKMAKILNCSIEDIVMCFCDEDDKEAV